MDKQTSLLLQVVLSVVASGTGVSTGMCVAFPAVFLPTVSLDRDPSFWVAALPLVTMAFACLVVGPLMDRRGRRLGLILSSLPAATGWLLMGGLGSLWSVYIGRLLTGISMGFSTPAVSVFIAEIASPVTRSALSVANSITFSVGATVTYLLGYFFRDDWRLVAVACGLFPLACLILTVIFIPESEVWKAERRVSRRHWVLDLPEAFARPQVTKPTLIINSLIFLRQMAGTTSIYSFFVEILEGSGIVGDKYLTAGGLGGVRTASSLLAAWLSSSLGRRNPVIYSSATTSATLFHLSYLVAYPSSLIYLPVCVLFVFILASTVTSSIAQAMPAELFPTDVRGMSVGLSNLNMCISSFIAMWMYGKMMTKYGLSGLFLVYGVFYVISTILTIFFLPETHGKTLKEIELIFIKNKKIEEEVPLDKAGKKIEIDEAPRVMKKPGNENMNDDIT